MTPPRVDPDRPVLHLLAAAAPDASPAAAPPGDQRRPGTPFETEFQAYLRTLKLTLADAALDLNKHEYRILLTVVRIQTHHELFGCLPEDVA